MSLKNKTLESCTPTKQLNFAKKIVIVDGMIGGGKSLVCSVISSLPNVETWIDKPQFEQVCALYHLDHLSLDAAKTLINTWIEEDIMKQSMSRDTNFKPSDASSVFQYARPLKYFKRLFKSPLEAKKSVEEEKPILNFNTHVITSYAKPLFEAIGDRLVWVRVTRHPMSTLMFKHNKNWTERFRKDDRHGTILYKTMDQKSNLTFVPFYANTIEKNYVDASLTDKAILLFDQWIRDSDNFIDKTIKSTDATIIEVPYEKFVFQPEIYIKKIALSLGVTPDNKTKKMMRRQGVPRKVLTDAPKNQHYINMGWEPPKKKFTLAEYFAQGRAYAAETASTEALHTLDELAELYEARHDIQK